MSGPSGVTGLIWAVDGDCVPTMPTSGASGRTGIIRAADGDCIPTMPTSGPSGRTPIIRARAGGPWLAGAGAGWLGTTLFSPYAYPIPDPYAEVPTVWNGPGTWRPHPGEWWGDYANLAAPPIVPSGTPEDWFTFSTGYGAIDWNGQSTGAIPPVDAVEAKVTMATSGGTKDIFVTGYLYAESDYTAAGPTWMRLLKNGTVIQWFHPDTWYPDSGGWHDLTWAHQVFTFVTTGVTCDEGDVFTVTDWGVPYEPNDYSRIQTYLDIQFWEPGTIPSWMVP